MYLTYSNKENKSCKKEESRVEYLLGIPFRGEGKKHTSTFHKSTEEESNL